MTDGILIANYEAIKPLEESLECIGELHETFKTMFRYARPYAIKQITNHAKEIGANIVAIEREGMVNADERKIFIEGKYYRLK